MQYEVIKINEAGAETQYTSIDDYIEQNACEHMVHARQIGVKVLGIAESYNNDAERILTDKGYLFVKISNDTYHLYHLFAEPSVLDYGHVLIINEPLDVHSVSYENTHRLVLYKNKSPDAINPNLYRADGIEYGVVGSIKNDLDQDVPIHLYRLDVDGFIDNNSGHARIYYPEADGYYHTTFPMNEIKYFLISYKQYVYIHLNPSDTITIKLVNVDGGEIKSKFYKFDNNNFYIDEESTISGGEQLTDPDEGLDITPKSQYTDRDDNQYMCIAFYSDDPNAPEQVLLEVC